MKIIDAVEYEQKRIDEAAARLAATGDEDGGKHVVDPRGTPITGKLLDYALGEAWEGRDHATTIQANAELIRYIKYIGFPGMIPEEVTQYVGAALVVNETIPADEIHLLVPVNRESPAEINNEQSVRIVRVIAGEIDQLSVHSPRSERYSPHLVVVTLEVWNELFNAMDPEDSYLETLPGDGRMAIWLMNPFGRKLRIVAGDPEKKAR